MSKGSQVSPIRPRESAAQQDHVRRDSDYLAMNPPNGRALKAPPSSHERALACADACLGTAAHAISLADETVGPRRG